MSEKELLLPDIGDFENVEVIEMHVTAGDTVKIEDPLLKKRLPVLRRVP